MKTLEREVFWSADRIGSDICYRARRSLVRSLVRTRVHHPDPRRQYACSV